MICSSPNPGYGKPGPTVWPAFIDVDADYPIVDSIKCINVDASGGDKTVTLPSLAPGNYIIKKANVSGGNVIVLGTENIDGAPSITITQPNATRTIIDGETEWKIA